MVFNTDIDDPLERIKDFWERNIDDKSWYDSPLFAALRPHSATLHSRSRASATFLLTVPKNLCNRAGNLHGGAAASLFDLATSIALAPLSRGGESGEEEGGKPEQPPFWMLAGVSRTLNCTYLRPVPEGSTVALVCDVLGISKRLCALKGEMRAWDADKGEPTGELLVVCEHGKVNVDPKVAVGSSKL